MLSLFRKAYSITAVLAVLLFLLAYFRMPVAFFLYGHDPSLIGSSSFEAFVAYDETLSLRKFIFYFAVLIAAVCLALSVIAAYMKLFVHRSIPYTIAGLCLILLAIYGVAATLPKRVV